MSLSKFAACRIIPLLGTLLPDRLQVFQRMPNPIKMSLDGFKGALDGPAMEQSKLVETQKKLQEEMQKKADEARKKLEGQQAAPTR